MSIYKEIAEEIGDVVDVKNAAYGSSFAKSGDFLRLLYPDGISVDRYEDMLLVVRIFDKQMRIATDRDALGESPFGDIAGYGILGVSLHHERKEAACGSPSSQPVSANAQAATESPLATPASAATSASEPTTLSANASSVSSSASSYSQRPASSSSSTVPADASAPTVTAPAGGASEDVRLEESDLAYIVRRWHCRHNIQTCTFCSSRQPNNFVKLWYFVNIRVPAGWHEYRTCSFSCISKLRSQATLLGFEVRS
jgi:hypothetical protein